MKRLIYFLSLLLFSIISLSAQEYVVKSFDIAPTDLTARTTGKRVDANGRACALIKVYAGDRIAAVHGPVVGEVGGAGMEKLVYLSHDSKMMELVFDNHLPLMINFGDYNYPTVTGQMTYILRLEDKNGGGNVNVAGGNSVATGNPGSNNAATTSSDGGEVESFTVNGVTFEMVRVDGGSFMMGSEDGENDEKPVHRENVSTFYIGKTEVTQALWKAVMGDDPSYFKGANRPVENVSWDDCQEFVDRLSRLTGKRFRLPTEAEWEYAARGGNRSRGYTYSGSDNIDRVAWYNEDSGNKTHPVAQKLDNELGIYDMSGNVWEWTSDRYNKNYNFIRNSSNRVIRGGCCLDLVSTCRVAYRFRSSSDSSQKEVGLRLAF